MKEIKLTQGKVTIVDDEDFEGVNRLRWYASKNGNTYYAHHNINKMDGKQTTIKMHKFIVGEKNNMEIDHINHNGLDNRRCNLRFGSHAQNMSNMLKTKTNSSGFKGVTWHKGTKKWQARIKNNYKLIYLGLFSDKQKAIDAHSDASIKYHGVFSLTSAINAKESQ